MFVGALTARAYDPVGNRLTRGTQAYAYDANDRVSGATYDANGNTVTATLPHPVTGQPGQVFDQYDYADQLKDRNSGQIRLVYDGDGNRVAKTVNGVTTFYLVDDLNPSGYAQVVEELQASTLSPLPLVTRVYTYDYALNSQQQWLPDGQGGFAWAASFYGYDDHGSVRYLTDAAGNVTDTYDYDAFGNVVQQGGGTPNLYLYAGEQFDPDLQLYYLRARYLNPDTGRVLDARPVRGLPGRSLQPQRLPLREQRSRQSLGSQRSFHPGRNPAGPGHWRAVEVHAPGRAVSQGGTDGLPGGQQGGQGAPGG